MSGLTTLQSIIAVLLVTISTFTGCFIFIRLSCGTYIAIRITSQVFVAVILVIIIVCLCVFIAKLIPV